MKKHFLAVLLLLSAAGTVSAQVKIGYNAASNLNNAAVLELSNNITAPANTWRAQILPYVNFTSVTDFADSSVWGIAGSATDGAIVYNIGARNSDGFKGMGVYVWTNDAWIPLNNMWSGSSCTDPGATVGSTGCVSFTYKGQPVVYPTVRAADGHIWITKNLGAAQIASSVTDASSYGDLFQWGRWDDGHQTPTSFLMGTSGLTTNDPAGLGTGNANFLVGTPPNDWWGGGTGTDTWSGNPPSATNGKDPCTVLGTGWHIATETEWGSVITVEGITNTATAFASNLKLPAPGSRDWGTGTLINVGSVGLYWSSSTSGQYAKVVQIQNSAILPSDDSYRSYGQSVRCMKN